MVLEAAELPDLLLQNTNQMTQSLGSGLATQEPVYSYYSTYG